MPLVKIGPGFVARQYLGRMIMKKILSLTRVHKFEYARQTTGRQQKLHAYEGVLKVSKSRNKIVESELLPKNELRKSALEVYYFKVNAKRESMFFLQEDRLSFVLTLK